VAAIQKMRSPFLFTFLLISILAICFVHSIHNHHHHSPQLVVEGDQVDNKGANDIIKLVKIVVLMNLLEQTSKTFILLSVFFLFPPLGKNQLGNYLNDSPPSFYFQLIISADSGGEGIRSRRVRDVGE